MVDAVSVTGLDDYDHYLEGSGFVNVDDEITVAGGGDFTLGYIEFSIDNATANEFLDLQNSPAISDIDGTVSVLDSTVYRGTGSGHEVIGNFDPTFNGEDGQPLRVNFNNFFENGDFSEGSNGSVTITGWTSQVNEGVSGFARLDGVYEIAGQPTPVDTTYPAPNVSRQYFDESVPRSGQTFTQVAELATEGGDYAVRLFTGAASINQSFGVIRGPYVYSDGTVALADGDSVSFDWRALAGGDAYDAYGYLIDVNTGDTITLLDETGTSSGSSTNWATETINIGAGEEGIYRFVFVAGSYDLSGGNYVGGSLMIDDVTVTQANPPGQVSAADLTTISDGILYNNTADEFADLTRQLTVTASMESGNSDSDQATITILPVNDAPTLNATNLTVNEDAGAQSVTWSVSPVESGQELVDIKTTNDNNALFSAQPALDENGVLTFTPAADAFGAATVSVRLTDNGGTANGGQDRASHSFTITVDPVNDAPEIISNGGGNTATIYALEERFAVTNVFANDAENDDLAFSLSGGADRGQFSIDEDSGFLVFRSAPYIASPTDSDGDNIYEVSVQVSDGNGGTDTQALNIQVGDALTPPQPVIPAASSPLPEVVFVPPEVHEQLPPAQQQPDAPAAEPHPVAPAGPLDDMTVPPAPVADDGDSPIFVGLLGMPQFEDGFHIHPA